MRPWLPLIVAAFFSQTLAWADFVKGSQTLALYGGFGSSASRYDYKPGDHQPITGPGGAFGGQYLYYFRNVPSLAFGADVISALNGDRHHPDELAGYDTNARLKSLVGLFITRLAYPKGELRPYVFAGVGAHHSSQQFSAQPESGNTWAGGGTDRRILVDEHHTSAAVGYGIGIDLYAAETFFIGAEWRAVRLGGLDTGDTAALRAAGFTVDHKEGSEQTYVLMHLGWTFK